MITGRVTMINEHPPHRKKIHVVHVGVIGDSPGGMAQVVNEYLSWKFDGAELSTLRSTRGRHDPASPLYFLIAIGALVAFRLKGFPAVAVFHLSQRGSFLREGTLAQISFLLGLPTVLQLHGSQFADFAASRP